MRRIIGALGTVLLIATAACGSSTTKTVTVASTGSGPSPTVTITNDVTTSTPASVPSTSVATTNTPAPPATTAAQSAPKKKPSYLTLNDRGSLNALAKTWNKRDDRSTRRWNRCNTVHPNNVDIKAWYACVGAEAFAVYVKASKSLAKLAHQLSGKVAAGTCQTALLKYQDSQSQEAVLAAQQTTAARTGDVDTFNRISNGFSAMTSGGEIRAGLNLSCAKPKG